MTQYLLNHRDWIGVNWIDKDVTTDDAPNRALRVFDYACGPGMVSQVNPPSPRLIERILPDG